MAAEISLKEESAIEIGKQLAFSFQGLKAVGADTVNDGLELEEEKQQTSYLDSISSGIKKMVMFFGGIAAATKEARRDRLITEAQGTEAEKEALADDPDRSLGIKDMLKGLTEKTKDFGGRITGIFGGLFGKAALFGLLLAFSLNLDKFSGQIKEVVGPIFDGLKAAFKSLKEDVFPVLENILKFVGEAFESVTNIVKGIFEGDAGTFLKGVKGILVDLPLRLVSIIGDAFFSLVDAVLNFFGVDSQMVQDIKIAFRTFPEAIKKAVTDFVDFFTVDIPKKFNEIKDKVTTGFSDMVTKVKDSVTGVVDDVFNKIKNAFTDIKDLFFSPFKAIKDKVKSFFGFSTDTVTNGDPEASAQATALTEDKSKVEALKEKRLTIIEKFDGEDSASAKNTFAQKMKQVNAAIIREEGRGEDHKFVNSQMPLEYGKADLRGTTDRLVADIMRPLQMQNNDVELPQSNTPMIEPSELQNNGGQLNRDSQEFASANNTTNFNVLKGGDNTNVSSNQTYTNISENTTTSDSNAKKIFKSA